jgi:uncharacterized protein YegP (UPF0339 family)
MKAKIELFQDVNHCWHFRIKASNRKILASSEAYSSKTQCEDTAIALAGVTGLMLQECKPKAK